MRRVTALIAGAVCVAGVGGATTVYADDAPTKPAARATWSAVPDAAERFSGAFSAAGSVATNPQYESEMRAAVADSYGETQATFAVRSFVRDGVEISVGVGLRGTCFSETGASGAGSMACAPNVTATSVARPIVSVTQVKGGYRVSGLLVDGVSDPVVYLADGTKQPVQLEANMFVTKVTQAPTRLTFRAPDGRTLAVELSS